MNKLILLLFFAIALFSCEPEETPPPPKIPEVEQPSPTEPDPESIEVFEVFPAKNDIGDTITIKGKNFSRNLSISLQEMKLGPILLNDSLIKIRVPFGNYDPFDFQLKLEYEEQDTILQNPFELYAPVIDSIAGKPRFNEQVVLYGKHLTNSPGKKNDILFLDDMDVQVISHSADSLVFHLGWEVKKYEYDILVKAQLQEVRKPGGLKIEPPAFKKLSKTEVEIGENLTIYGANFYLNRPGLHEVSFQGNRAEVVEAYRDSLIVKIPMGPYKSRKIDELKIKLFEKETIFDVDIHITSTWYMYGYKKDYDISHGTGSVGNISRWSFAANNAFYFNVYRRTESNLAINNVLYKYTPEDEQWEEIDLGLISDDLNFEDVYEFYHQEGTSNVLIYLYRDTNNFFKFNLETKKLVQLKDHPIESFLQHGIGFHLNGNFYFGHGYYTKDMQTVSNRMFWRYDHSSNTWTEVGNMPDVQEEYGRLGTSIFQTGNSILLGNGHEIAYDFWEFSANETWSRKSDITNPTSGVVSVQNGQKGFYYDYHGSSFWEYDISGDFWTRREDLKIKNYPTGHETMFIHGDYIYYVGYLLDYGPEGTPYFRYDHAILRTELSNF